MVFVVALKEIVHMMKKKKNSNRDLIDAKIFAVTLPFVFNEPKFVYTSLRPFVGRSKPSPFYATT